MAVVLGLAVALCYGTADFFGGLTSKRNDTAAVVALSQLAGLALLVVAALAGGGDASGRDLAFGAAAGSIGLCGLLLLYRGLAVGAMSVVAPVTAVGAALVPVAWGLLTGERPSALALGGVALALAAVVLVAGGPQVEEEALPPRLHTGGELALAGGAGLAFGVVFVLLAETGEGSGLWPVLAARVASVSLVTSALLVTGRRPTVVAGTRAGVLAAGAFDAAANAIYLIAVRQGLLSLVSVLSSLYPAATVLLARAVLAERITPRQTAGLAAALAGVALIATG